jgi:surface antigen
MKTLKALSLLATTIGMCATSQASISYVKANASGLNNGTSWANAYTDLQAASAATSDTLWVANGEYKPTNTNNRAITFNFGVKKVFGGFAGNETLLNQRNYSLYQTVLSGDLGTASLTSDNTHHVVTVNTAQGVLDGFKITGGNANDPSGGNGIGAGIKIAGQAGIATYINNCLITANDAISGGGVSNTEGANVFLQSCKLLSNSAQSEGGAMTSSTPIGIGNANIHDCIFYGNKAASGDGGAIWFSGAMTIERSSFSGNNAVNGGAIFVAVSPIRSNLTLSNSLIAGNVGKHGSAVYMANNPGGQFLSNAIISYSTFSGNKTDLNDYALYLPMKSQLHNSIIWGNLTGTSPQINVPTGAYNNIIENAASTLNNSFGFDPAFINPGLASAAPFNAGNYNYQLLNASQAIERGIEVFSPGFGNDIAMNSRVFGVNPDLGCYEMTYCVATPSGDITVDGNDTSFCLGTAFNITLTAPAGVNYNWSNRAVTATTTVSAAGTYKVAVLNTAGCRAIYSKTIVVTPLPVPVVTQNNGVLSAGSFASYQWMKDGVNIAGATGQTFTTNASGNYKVKVTNANGCEGISLPVTVSTLGISELNNQKSVGLYPNPVTDRATIDVSAVKGTVQSYTVSDMMGRRVMLVNQVAVKNNTLELIPPAALTNGSYILNLITDKGAYSTKFVLKR